MQKLTAEQKAILDRERRNNRFIINYRDLGFDALCRIEKLGCFKDLPREATKYLQSKKYQKI